MRQPCAIGLPVMALLRERGAGTGAVIIAQQISATFCALKEERFVEAAEELRVLERRYDIPGFDRVALYLADKLDDGDAALARLELMARENDGATLLELEPEQFWWVSRTISRAGMVNEFNTFALDLYESDLFAKLNTDLQSGVARRGLLPAIVAGRAQTIESILAEPFSPSTIVDLLVTRDFEEIWPQIEAASGANIAGAAEKYRDWASARLAEAPNDRDRFSTAARAHYFAGEFEAAVGLVGNWRTQQSALDTIEAGEAWAMNIEAYALDSLGRLDEADAVFDQLAELDQTNQSWVVSFVINRASRLVGQERWAEGLEASQLARDVAKDHGSTFARMIVARDFTCALINLGRSDEIEPEIEFLFEHQEDGVVLATTALQCAGRNDQAVALALSALAKERLRDGVIENIQPDAFDLFYTRSELPTLRDLLPDYPELATAFAAHARMLPDEFTPVAAIRREQVREEMRQEMRD